MNSFQYELEGDIDFFKELKNITTTSHDATTADSETPRCLITDEPLQNDAVELKCGHRFNYIPLYKEVLFQKCSLLPKNVSTKIVASYTKPTTANSASSALPIVSSSSLLSQHNPNIQTVSYNSSYNLETTKLNYDEIKCPYCRRITPNILPYYPYPEVSKVKYVNIPTNLALKGVSCEYYKHVSGGNDETVCPTLPLYNETHRLVLCKKHATKLDSSNPKLKTKSTPKLGGSKTAANTTAKTHDENVIISHHNPAAALASENTGCPFLLLSGPRKGSACGKPKWTSASAPGSKYCKAHYEKGNSTSS